MHKLDEVALNIELVLISIIEGVALATLGAVATEVLAAPFNATSYVFVLAGLLLLLVFWSQAILHAVSFIRWPLRMEHMLLYFLAAFLQIIAYNAIDNPVHWFFWWSVFSVLVLITYAVDLRLIEDATPSFAHLPDGTAYMGEVMRRHKYEFKFLVPVSVAFNLVAFGAVYLYGANPIVALTSGILQVLISFGALVDCVKNFKTRSALIPRLPA